MQCAVCGKKGCRRHNNTDRKETLQVSGLLGSTIYVFSPPLLSSPSLPPSLPPSSPSLPPSLPPSSPSLLSLPSSHSFLPPSLHLSLSLCSHGMVSLLQKLWTVQSLRWVRVSLSVTVTEYSTYSTAFIHFFYLQFLEIVLQRFVYSWHRYIIVWYCMSECVLGMRFACPAQHVG